MNNAINKFLLTGYNCHFQRNMTYDAYKDLPRRTAYDKVLQKKSLTIDSNPQHD